ncbi:glycosyltransferase family 9 protein [Microbacterium trichothecenolyticum]|uniref:ADP-heptose:LPS heptosyltransferase n=1 Tax=Microbacterium trichothecenolyticum TaxID=69370 RepID=A0ABU0TSE9_MICTR|nr:glycosyltransferase family 9 protein [Microbacterium trichothecenolyticum]MDQ1122607.1 ADP-heptose:LPS heptosyltransferase [Microbacterium trichothecenolyticum]
MQPWNDTDDRPALIALRTLKLGDLLVAVPAVRALRRGFPHHRLVLAVPGWLEPIVELIPGVDALLPTPGLDDALPVAPGRVDVAVNLHGSGPESRRVVDLLGARLTIAHRVAEIDGDDPADRRMPHWQPDLLERRRWVRLVEAYGICGDENDVALGPSARRTGIRGACVVHVGAFYGSRRWPVERFAAVAASLRADGHDVVFTGSGAERERALAVSRRAGFGDDAVLAGVLDLAEFAALVEDARLVVSADTGAAHLASAYARPSVILFGPAAPENWGPPPGPHLVLTDASRRRGETFAAEPDPALLAVTVDDVLAGVERVMGPR